MTKRELKRWQKAAALARAAMGSDRYGPRWKSDPLAWWCLTQAIYEL